MLWIPKYKYQVNWPSAAQIASFDMIYLNSTFKFLAAFNGFSPFTVFAKSFIIDFDSVLDTVLFWNISWFFLAFFGIFAISAKLGFKNALQNYN